MYICIIIALTVMSCRHEVSLGGDYDAEADIIEREEATVTDICTDARGGA